MWAMHQEMWLCPLAAAQSEAFFHARYFLEMACRYANPPEGHVLPSGWAGLLSLFELR